MKKILVACEESQTVTKAFRELGYEAWSCDIERESGGHPEWHIRGDVLGILRDGWSMMLAFPPCTHLAVSGARWFAEKRKDGRQQRGIDFFMSLVMAPIAKIVIENPVGIMSSIYRKPDQIIQPYQFGHKERKATCLWLKGLPLLKPVDNVYDEMMKLPKSKRERLHYLSPSPDRARLRSKTFPGIAKAFADQYSKFI